MIREAKFTDKDIVCTIYEKAKAAMKEMGINQWQDGYPNENSFISDVENKLSVICEDEGNIIATAAAYIGHEPTYDKIFEGQWLTDNNEYGIIHRIAVEPSAKKKGVATQVMCYVEELCRKNNIHSMRCDTHRDNKIMQHTLTKNGYKYCGIIYLSDGDERFGYEKVL